ncbi:conjugative transposon protein TraN [Cruoricaptor ignavus]|uniref:Conjugative transposon protein TraN n=1 Tax=Cruoricaptor ignavus TaxID=1118202 RepID=A0A7M1T446_9FLAO|nr:conjugative transposon protein TraN [Cruoricaptor ignavus]QOR74610.1 conjugative transposon protein TraN [Cruoricaptor ignavus]
MKQIFSTLVLLFSFVAFAQTPTEIKQMNNLTTVLMAKDVNLHFISPEPIQFVDLSSNKFSGDLPARNIARVKLNDHSVIDSVQGKPFEYYNGEDIGVITLVAQSFMAQYKVVYSNSASTTTQIQIQAEDMHPMQYPSMAMSESEMRSFANKILFSKAKKPIRTERNLKLKMSLNNVYVIDDHIFLDISVENQSNLGYDIEDIKFSIEDKKIYKATNNQSIDLTPKYQWNGKRKFRKSFRNIYVFDKFTFPDSKILKIRLIEEQVSGRTIEMKVNYSDVLNADTL